MTTDPATPTASVPHMMLKADVAGERGPTLLTEAELNHVAAAGSKPGSATDGRGLLGTGRELIRLR